MAEEAVSDEAVRAELETLMLLLSDVAFRRDELVLERAKLLKAIEEEVRPRVETIHGEFDPRINELNERIDALTDSIRTVAEPRFMRLVKKGTKTIKLRFGEISHRANPPSMQVADKKALLRRLKKLGMLRKFTKLVRDINNAVLKQALLDDPELAKKIPEARIEQEENLIVKPGKTDAEFTISVPAGSIDVQEQKED